MSKCLLYRLLLDLKTRPVRSATGNQEQGIDEEECAQCTRAGCHDLALIMYSSTITDEEQWQHKTPVCSTPQYSHVDVRCDQVRSTCIPLVRVSGVRAGVRGGAVMNAGFERFSAVKCVLCLRTRAVVCGLTLALRHRPAMLSSLRDDFISCSVL